MTIHKKMFDKKEHLVNDTLHRVYVSWDSGYFITSLDPEFRKHLQEMVADLGSPTSVTYRDTDEGWYEGDGCADECDYDGHIFWSDHH